MNRHWSTAILVGVAVGLWVTAAASPWTFVPDRMNNPVYNGVSGLLGTPSGTTVHIWGSNSDTPPGARIPEDAELFWPGLAAEGSTVFGMVTVETTAALSGTGTGFQNGIVLWQDPQRYILYGLDYDLTSGLNYVPSRWTALGGWPNPGFAPSWTRLAASVSNLTGPHTYRVDYRDGIVRFWLDGALLDTLEYPMSSVKVRLAGYARAYGDSVDAAYNDASVSGTAIPEPSTILALLSGLFGFTSHRRKSGVLRWSHGKAQEGEKGRSGRAVPA